MESNKKEKGLQPCPFCKKEFSQLSRHAPHCKKRPEIEDGKPFVKLGVEEDHNDHQPSGKTITAKEVRQAQDGVKATETPREICNGCGKAFSQLKKHKTYCKGIKSKTTDSESSPSSEQDLDIKVHEKKKVPSVSRPSKQCEAEEERDTTILTKDVLSRFRKLELQHLEPTPQRKLMDSAPSMEQGKTNCPYCGKGYTHLQKHTRACKKKQSYLSGPTSIDENALHCGSSDQTQQKQNQSKGSGKKENVLERRDSVELSSTTVDEENAKGNHKHQNDHRDTDYLRSLKQLLTPISNNSSSLADIEFSEDPKAALDSLQAGNEIDEVEISMAGEVIKELEDSFLRKLNEYNSFKWTILRTGSYSDETKIQSANEFDFIVSLDIKCSVECLEEPNTLGYCLVIPSCERNVPQEISSLMTDKYLNPILVKKMAFSLFDQVILDADLRKGRRIKRLHREYGSPAYTITYSSGAGTDYDIDLVPAIHFDGWPQIAAIKDWQPRWRQKHSIKELKKDFFAVARENPNAKTLRQRELLWRLSFSRTEKMLWMSADNNDSMPTCRKHILKILKRILEDCKDGNAAMMPHLSSFHLRTFMLHQYDQRPYDNDWLEKDKRKCLHVCLAELRQILSRRHMNNYYICGHNILYNLEDDEIEIFTEALLKASATY